MSLVNIELHFPDIAKLLRGREDEINRFITAQMQFNRGMLFDQEGGYNGHQKWAPLGFRSGQTLSQRGVLRKSIAPTSRSGKPGQGGYVVQKSDRITIGTNLFYAAMMNYGTTNLPGGVLKPRNAKALKIPIPQGMKAGIVAKELNKTNTQKQIRKLQGKLSRARSKESAQKIMFKIRELSMKKDFSKGPKKFLFVKSVKIPARPFDQWNDNDQLELSEALCNKLADIIEGN